MTVPNAPPTEAAPMPPEEWSRVRALVEEALTHAPETRRGFLDASCGGDPSLRDRVQRLAAACERGETWGFLARPAGELAAPLLVAPVSPPGEGKPGLTSGDLARLRTALAHSYRIERELGAGGMATVYLAHDLKHERRVAIKVIHPEMAFTLGGDRFLSEIKTTAALQHPNIVALFDSGTADGLLFYVMPLIEGETLRARLAREIQLPVAEAVRIASEVAGALDYAHRRGVIHRDIKPENILLHEGRPVVADFGIALAVQSAASVERMTLPGTSLGTPHYMSPEQASGADHLDPRTDVYALGCVLYEMLAGEPPFSGSTAAAIMARHVTAPVPSIRALRPTVPVEVDDLIQRALAKLPADRILDAQSFSAEAERIVIGLAAGRVSPGVASPDSAFTVRRLARSRRAIVAAGVVVLAATSYVASTRNRPWDRTANAEQSAVSKRGPLDRLRVAVVPFRTVGDPIDPYFADVLTDELISALARRERLRVLSRSSVKSLGEATTSPEAIGRAVSAGSIVEGTIRRSADSLGFHLALVDASSGEQLWSADYARSVSDALGVSDSAANAIANRLGAPDDASPRSTAPVTASSAAYDAYLRGRFIQHRDGAGVETVARQDSAIRWFERALALDRDFALAYTAIADVYSSRFFGIDPDPQWQERAFVAIEKALAIDPSLAEAYQEKGDLLWTLANGFPHEAAAKLHRRAADLKPSLVDPHQSLGSLYMHVGLLDRALAEYDIALALEPGTTFVPPRIARVHWYQGKYTQALADYDAVPLLFASAAAERALVLNYLGRSAEALVMLDTAARAGRAGQQGDFDAARAVIHAARGERTAALHAIERSLREGQDGSHFHHAAYSIAESYALLGEADKALEFLNRTAASGMPCYPLFRDDPHLRSLASDPRFQRFMETTRLRWEELTKKLSIP